MNIGTSSILLVFVILCLVSFATLSLSSALADRNLSDKATEKTLSYYKAQNLAQMKIAETDHKLEKIYNETANAEDYFAKAGEKITFTVTLSDNQAIEVILTVLYPDKDGDPYYEIASFREIRTVEDEAYNDTVELIL